MKSSKKEHVIKEMEAQVVPGIGSLGAGVIIRDGLNVRGIEC